MLIAIIELPLQKADITIITITPTLQGEGMEE
jgi:hypothetical protein